MLLTDSFRCRDSYRIASHFAIAWGFTIALVVVLGACGGGGQSGGQSSSRSMKYAQESQKGAKAFSRAQKWESADEFEKAARHFHRAAQISPDSASVHFNEAIARLNAERLKQDGNMGNVIPVLERYFNVADRPQENAYNILSALYQKENQPTKTIDLLEKVPGDLSAELEGRLLNAYNRAGQTDKAMDKYRKLIQENPENVTYRYNYGSMLLNEKLYDPAIEQLKKTVDLDPTNAKAQYNLGAAYVNKARAAQEGESKSLYRQGISPLKYALQLTDSGESIRKDACQALITAYVKTGQTESAREHEECAGKRAEEVEEQVDEAIASRREKAPRQGGKPSEEKKRERTESVQDQAESDQPSKRTAKNFPTIDTKIPNTSMNRPDDIAVVIGNKEYRNADLPNVDYAVRDARILKKYLTRTLGFREENVIYLENANAAAMTRVFGTTDDPKGQLHNWVKPGKSRVFVYYSGHGAPNPETGNAYLVASNTNPNYLSQNGYPLSQLYENLAKVPAQSITVVLEACFSGTSQSGAVVQNASPAVLSVENPMLSMDQGLVFTAGATDQIASWYPEKKHGLFTYYFLKGLRGTADGNSDRTVTAKEMKSYLADKVPYRARRMYNREQTPQVLGKNKRRVLVRLAESTSQR